MKTLVCFFISLSCSIGSFCQTGTFWGTTYNTYGDGGRIYHFSSDGTNPVLVKTLTQVDRDGATPDESPLLLASDNLLYGTTSHGGKYQSGTFFSIDPTTLEFTLLYDFTFDQGQSGTPGPNGALTEGSDGFLYGFQEGGARMFKIKRDGTDYQDLGSTGVYAMHAGGFTVGSDNNLYFVTPTAFSSSAGQVFSVTTSGTRTKILDLPTGQSGAGKMLKASNGKLYGCSSHLTTHASIVFWCDNDGQNFQSASIPDGIITRVIEGPGSKIYGLVAGLAGDKSGLFEIGLNGTGYSLLHQFDAGHEAFGELAIDGNTIYGTTRNEEDPEANIIYRYEIGGDGYSVVSQIPKEDGVMPVGVTLTANDVLFVPNESDIYGFELGNIVKVKTDGTGFGVAKDFFVPNDGTVFGVRLTELPTGEIMGVTVAGGENKMGVIFKIDHNDQYHVLFNFDGVNTGSFPYDGLIAGPDNFYYGVTSAGGANGGGVIYRINGDGTGFEKLFDFDQDSGTEPYGGLTLVGGRLYGMTGAGGSDDMGTVFGIDPDGSDFEKLVDFNDEKGGYPPFSSVLTYDNGFLYGCLSEGGSEGKGVVFKVTPGGTDYQILFDAGDTDFAYPTSAFVKSDGDLLVILTRGGTFDRGAIYSVNADGSGHELVHEFDVTLPDANVITNGPLTRGPDGKLWSVEPNGGSNGTGTVYNMNEDGSDYTRIELNLDSNPMGYMMPWWGLLYVEHIEEPGKLAQTIHFPEPSAQSFDTGTLELNATATSGLVVTYSTTDDDKISIDGNVVTMLKPGRVTISASQDGNDEYEPAEPVDQTFCINPSKPVITVSAAGDVVTLTSSNDTGNQWYSDGSIIGNATGKNFEATEDGTYAVKTTVDNCSSPSSDNKVVTITGLGDEMDLSIKLYPSPATNEIFVTTPRQSNVSIMDINGRTLDGRTVDGNSTSRFITESFGKGIYILRVETDKAVVIKRFLKL